MRHRGGTKSCGEDKDCKHSHWRGLLYRAKRDFSDGVLIVIVLRVLSVLIERETFIRIRIYSNDFNVLS